MLLQCSHYSLVPVCPCLLALAWSLVPVTMQITLGRHTVAVSSCQGDHRCICLLIVLGRKTKLVVCRRVAKSTGASVVTTLADMDGQESFDASSLGQADEVIVKHKMIPIVLSLMLQPSSPLQMPRCSLPLLLGVEASCSDM